MNCLAYTGTQRLLLLKGRGKTKVLFFLFLTYTLYSGADEDGSIL
jgi:hypothetical protein